MSSITDDLLFDREHVWHPYTSMTHPLQVYHVESASGVNLYLSDGQKLVDGMSSWWCAVHGYSHPQLVQAAIRQVEKLSHVMFGGLTHSPAIELCRKLVEITPAGLEHVFLADSGSVAVEIAMKMALQFYSVQEKPKKSRFLTIRSGYHGDTWHTMSVCDPDTGMHSLYNGNLPPQLFISRPSCPLGEPWDPSSMDELRQAVSSYSDEIAALILEPIVQGAGGVYFYHPKFLVEARKICDENDILLIADEIATGFGRTGKLFACEWAGISPDIMCLGKSLTGGMMTLSAVLTHTALAEGVSAGGLPFMHGPTFMGNPLACAVANAAVDLLLSSDWKKNIDTIEKQMIKELSPLSSHPRVNKVRVLGAIGVIETRVPVNMAAIQQFYVSQGVWIRPFGRLIYLMPPFIISESELRQLTQALSLSLDQDALFQQTED